MKTGHIHPPNPTRGRYLRPLSGGSMRLVNLGILGLLIAQTIITTARWVAGDCPDWYGQSIITLNCITCSILLDILRRDAR